MLKTIRLLETTEIKIIREITGKTYHDNEINEDIGRICRKRNIY